MGKIAFVFPGQGDQFPGMGKEWNKQYTEAAAVFAFCDELRPGTSKQCFEGSEEELKETKNTQPCLFAVEMAAFSVLREAGIRPEAVAGFSLGELAALTAAGVLGMGGGFRLVCKRGELMQAASEETDTAMAAVMRLSEAEVVKVCGRFSHVYPVNFNCPGQITVAGLSAEMKDFAAEVKAAGGRALPLKVRGAFHTPYMEKTAAIFAEELKKVKWGLNTVPVYANRTGRPYGGDYEQLLAEQICNAVRWEDTIRHMIGTGIDTFIEVGPGRTLSNMIRKIDGGVRTYTAAELPVLLSEVKPC
ncbi:MAG: ACP S-malonyltransferase [Clostridia bacterium]